MNYRKRFSRAALLSSCLLALLLAVLAGAGTAQQAQGPINIGIVTSLTGPASHVAREQVNGGELAVKEINKAGGVLGRQVALHVRDDQMRPDIGLRQFEELMQSQKIVALFGAVSGAVNVAVSGKAKEYRIPVAGVIQIRSYQAPGKQPYHWGTMSDAIAGLAGADFVREQLGKNQYLLYSDTAFGADLVFAWERGVKKFGGQLTGKDAVPMGTQDFAPYFTKVLAAKPDVLIMATGSADGVNAVKQFHELGMKSKMQIYIVFTDGRSTEAAIGPKAMEGVYEGVGFYWEIEKLHPTAKAFVSGYRTANKQVPGSQAYNVYAGIMAWADAARAAKSLDGEAILKVWGSPTFSFDHGKGKVRWRSPDRSPVEEWYICKGRPAGDVAKEPERILDVVKVMKASEDYSHTLADLGYK